MNISKIIPVIAVALALGCILVALPAANFQQVSIPTQDTQEMLAETPAGRQPETPIENDDDETQQDQPSVSRSMQEAEAAVRQIIAPYGDNVGIAVRSLNGSEGFSINGNERFTSASMIKLLILAELMNQTDAGSISLSESHSVRSGEIVGGTGVIGNMGAGTTLSMDQLASYMIAESDNTATNILIDRLGMNAINSRAATLGLESTDLQRKMMQLNSGVENHMSANDAAALLAGFANGQLASREKCNRAIEYLCAQSDNEALAAGIPGVRFGHKTGTLEGYRHDAGIVYAEQPYVIAVFTKNVSAPNSLMADISRTVYENLN